ncbi:hypothetical protein GH714_029125 [Hevea brasiliensis]|uniref:Ribosomal RNA methyltransferase FtsJ domain-containing protein n=1 Tax=Hevea brasiliensis TaxID=3981 RepID=A0A6A6K7H7_HEVBR|nr:hypothetical protein GH714_029125 [Hevea brasiliensis]
MTPEIPPKKNPPVNLAQPSAVCTWSGSFFLPVKVRLGAVDDTPSLNEAIPYIVKHMLRITTSPPAANDPAAPAYSVFLNGPAFTNGPTNNSPWASPTSIPLSSGLTAVLVMLDSNLASKFLVKLFVEWVKLEMHRSFRSFAVAKAGKIQIPKKKRRLDEICLERFQQYSRTFIQSWIYKFSVCVHVWEFILLLPCKVFVDGKMVSKAGTPISDKAVVEIIAEIPKYVCRAGYKLEAAIEQLGVDVAGKVALDSGLSTGGFTDCLLQHGASFVYGVDVGYGQVADKIRRDDRVCVVERTNLRYLPGLPQKVDLVTLDLSFISILLVMPAVVNVMKEDATLLPWLNLNLKLADHNAKQWNYLRLIGYVGFKALEKIVKGVENFGFCSKGWIESPLKGAEGNTEFLVYFSRMREKSTE